MRNLILTVSLLIGFLTSNLAQSDLQPLSSNEFGFNGTALISNLLPFNADSDVSSLDNLLFFKTGKDEFWFRAALNFNAESRSQDNNNFTNSLVFVKLGFEKKKRLSKSWVFHSGLDFFGGATTSRTESTDPFAGDFSSKQSQLRIGLAGVYGIQWMINDKIAIGSEGYLSLSALATTNKTEIQGSTNESKSDGFNMAIDLPRSLLFSIYFN